MPAQLVSLSLRERLRVAAASGAWGFAWRGLSVPWSAMADAMRQSRRFAAPSPVTRYWLANCVGFSLAGGGRGTVERVVVDADPYDPSLLEVRTSRWRVRRMPAEAVVAVVPADQLLVVDRRLAGLPDRRRAVALRLRWTGRVLWPGLRVATTFLLALGAEAWRLSRRAWAVGGPAVARTSRRGSSEAVRLGSEASRLVRSVPWQSYGRSAARTSRRGGSEAVRLGSEASRLVRSVPWRSYGHSARSATTRLPQNRSTRLSRRPTASSGRKNVSSSSEDSHRTSST
jgi:hypothetical protein